MFVDRAEIEVFAGNGGDGSASFFRTKHNPKGGPDGGDGGDGGNIVFIVEEGLNTLMDFRGTHHWRAPHGEAGSRKSCFGKAGEDCVIRVPQGTVILDHATGEPIADLTEHGQTFIAAKGGKGGRGNEAFKSATNQTPRTAEPGEPGEHKRLVLELKLIAEVGLLGMPNAGKSTLLSAVTRAQAKVGAYPFTTLAPQLGIASVDASRRLVIADIPGLIEGAAEGAGLGHEFLRHVERTRVLLHLVDCQPPDGSDPAENYRKIRGELSRYSRVLAEKPELIALNKLDLLEDEAARERAVEEMRAALAPVLVGRQVELVGMSGATGLGTAGVLDRLWTLIHPASDATSDGWKTEAQV